MSRAMNGLTGLILVVPLLDEEYSPAAVRFRVLFSTTTFDTARKYS